MFDEVQQQILDWINDFLWQDLLPEAIGLVFIVILALILARILKAVLNRVDKAIGKGSTINYAPWVRILLDLTRLVLLPLSFWLAGKGVIRILQTFGLPHGIIDYIMSFIGLWLVYRLLSGLIQMLMKPEKIHLWQDQILRPTFILLALMHLVGILDSILRYRINLGKGIVVTVGALIGGLVVVYIFVLLGRYVRGLLRDVILPRMDADPSLIPIVATFSGYIVIVFGVLAGLIVAGVDLTAMAVVLGGLFVGLGFGMKELVNNFVSGFILLFERSLTPGDIIHTSNASGVVEDIRLRSTRIRTNDNVQLIVPNGKLLGDVLTNYSEKEGTKRKRINIPVNTSAKDNPQQVMTALLQTAENHQHVLERPQPKVLVTDISGTTISYMLHAWVANTKLMNEVASELRLQILEMFTEHKFEMH
jgi:small-conductance mechanosensitive channel